MIYLGHVRNAAESQFADEDLLELSQRLVAREEESVDSNLFVGVFLLSE